MSLAKTTYEHPPHGRMPLDDPRRPLTYGYSSRARGKLAKALKAPNPATKLEASGGVEYMTESVMRSRNMLFGAMLGRN